MTTTPKTIPAQSSTQPSVDMAATRYGNKVLPTLKVRLKDGGQRIVINKYDFDPSKHEEAE